MKKLKPWKELLAAAGKYLKKYRYAALVLLLGVALLLLPTGQKEEKEESGQGENTQEVVDAEQTLEQRLAELLSQVDGAGRVSVMLSVRVGEETIYQTDTTTEQRQDEKTVVVTTVLAESDVPVTTKIVSPLYQGAVVVAEGGDSASVRLNLVSAVSSLTGLGADKITVMKMKAN